MNAVAWLLGASGRRPFRFLRPLWAVTLGIGLPMSLTLLADHGPEPSQVVLAVAVLASGLLPLWLANQAGSRVAGLARTGTVEELLGARVTPAMLADGALQFALLRSLGWALFFVAPLLATALPWGDGPEMWLVGAALALAITLFMVGSAAALTYPAVAFHSASQRLGPLARLLLGVLCLSGLYWLVAAVLSLPFLLAETVATALGERATFLHFGTLPLDLALFLALLLLFRALAEWCLQREGREATPAASRPPRERRSTASNPLLFRAGLLQPRLATRLVLFGGILAGSAAVAWSSDEFWPALVGLVALVQSVRVFADLVGTISRERQQRTFEMLALTGLTRRELIDGLAASASWLRIVEFLALLPVAVVAGGLPAGLAWILGLLLLATSAYLALWDSSGSLAAGPWRTVALAFGWFLLVGSTGDSLGDLPDSLALAAFLALIAVPGLLARSLALRNVSRSGGFVP